jgi:serine/threonine protein kinase
MGSDATAPMLQRGEDVFGLVGGRLEGKYDIEALVAEGGFGVVYRGVHRALQKTVAVKVLKVPEGLNSPLRKEYLEKFAHEARTIAQYEHPSIVRVLDFGASTMPRGEATPWMVLEWLDGPTLEQEFATRRGYGRTPGEVLGLLRPVLEALAYAHDEGIAHRDIKPGNIMLVTNRRNEVMVKLLDFGIAKSMGRGEQASGGFTATRTGLTAFSPLYAAPEQLSGARTGPWTDVHAMALVICEALLGEPVYPQDDTTALYAEALSPVRPTPAKFGVDVGPWEPVLQRALAVRPDQRYGHMRAFLDELTRAIGQVNAREVSPAGIDPVAPYSVAPTRSMLEREVSAGVGVVPSTFQPVMQTVDPPREPRTTGGPRWPTAVGFGVGVVLFGVGVQFGGGIWAVLFGVGVGQSVGAPASPTSAVPLTPVVVALPVAPTPEGAAPGEVLAEEAPRVERRSTPAAIHHVERHAAPAQAPRMARSVAPTAAVPEAPRPWVVPSPAPALALPAAAVAPEEELPLRLTRSQVTSVLSGLAGAVRQCAAGQTGTAPFSIIIANDGTVQVAALSGQFSGTPQGECMEGVVRRARFARFLTPTQTLAYPYVIQPLHIEPISAEQEPVPAVPDPPVARPILPRAPRQPLRHTEVEIE